MMLSILGNGLKSIHNDSSNDYKKSIINYEKKFKHYDLDMFLD